MNIGYISKEGRGKFRMNDTYLLDVKEYELAEDRKWRAWIKLLIWTTIAMSRPLLTRYCSIKFETDLGIMGGNKCQREL